MTTPITSQNALGAPSQVRLPRLSSHAARELRLRVDRVVREMDTAYSLVTDESSRLEWRLNPDPLFIEPDEWDVIETAVTQRARVVNSLLKDLYSRQEVLQQRLVPPNLVLADEAFRRPCVNLEPNLSTPATVLRFDLVNSAEDGWLFVDTYANFPVGAAFSVQNRRSLLQERGELYAALPDYRRIIDYPIQLLDHLKRLSPREKENPKMVVLTGGPGDPAYFEHSLLARKMGLPLAQGGDLLVLSDGVFFKTVAGIERIDVIYRRVRDSNIDPLSFPTNNLMGVPGLLRSIRDGKVVVANSIGVGVADNRGLERYLPQICRYFFGERQVLPGVKTYYLGDVDQLALVVEDGNEALSIVPAQETRSDLPAFYPGGSARDRKRVLSAVRREPHAYVARRVPESDWRRFRIGGRAHPDVRLSCFALCRENRVTVVAGGMARLLERGRKFDPPGWQVGKTADIIVLNRPGASPIEELAAPPAKARALMLGSRTADTLFWTGRYAERAESTARILSIIEDVGLEEISRNERRAWFPIWRGMLEATGHGEKVSRTSPNWFTPALAWHMTLDAENWSSLLASVRAVRMNTMQCRSFFSPESWTVLSHLSESLEELAEQGKGKRSTRAAIASQAINTVIDRLAAFFGTLDRTMLHDTGWHFFQVGMYLERAIMTCTALQHALVEAELAARHDRREDADLTALVRILSSQDAYRQTYQARVEPLFVAELLLLSRHAPKSVYSCLLELRDHVGAISKLTGLEDDAPLHETREALAALDGLDLVRFFSQRSDNPLLESPEGLSGIAEREPFRENPAEEFSSPERLAHWLDELLRRLNDLGTVLHDFYFSLQSRLAPDAVPARDGDGAN
jgi:uncharacterized circularly permuted ATP-grasp superfamily protein/uncharacterized alpha-E superfamily protein